MSRVAAVDCGTNSIRLLIADLDPAGTQLQRDVVRTMSIVRLGQDVDQTKRLADEAVARTLAVCEKYAAACREHEVESIRFCATSAVRDATNAAEFRQAVQGILGTEPVVLSGDEEAAMAYDGVVRDLHEAPEPVLVIDIGGGSTELILGDESGVREARSLDIGSVRMTERHLRTDPPTPTEIEAAKADIDAALDSCPVDVAAARTVVGVAGTITTVAAHALDLETYDSTRIHHARLAPEVVERSCAWLLGASVADRRALPFMHPGRADVIGGGALILQQALAKVGHIDLTISEHDILDGVAWSQV